MRAFCTILIALVVFSCAPLTEQEERIARKDVIPIEKMSLMLADIRLVESMLSVTNQMYGQDSVTQIAIAYYDTLFARHNISPENYYESLVYYSYEPHLLDTIYHASIAILMRNQSLEQYEPLKQKK